MARGEITCPFCGFRKEDDYEIQLHIEEHHTEDSPFNIINSAPDPPKISHPKASKAADTAPEDSGWIKCTRPGCGEYLLVADVQEHLDLHDAIDESEGDAEGAMAMSRQVASGDYVNGGSQGSNGSRRTGDGFQHLPQHLGRDESSGDDSSNRSGDRASGKPQQRNRWEGRSNVSLKGPPPSQNRNSSSGRTLLDYFSGNSTHGRPPLPPRKARRIEQPRQPGRLGTKELGPHAFEDKMPEGVRRSLLNDALPRQINRIGRDGRIIRESLIENETSGLIPVLAGLCARSHTTEVAYFCDPSVRHVHKIRCEGNFCGYWNIQMMSSFLAHNASKDGLLPNVLDIQNSIEQAWDNGICSYSRIETGGIRGTRKWIGTHDALAYFIQAGVSVQALSFKDEDEEQPAILSLLDHLEAYFMSGQDTAETRGLSRITSLPPVYFQRAGHSMTIVGLERKKDGHRNLLIFDPSFGTTGSMDQMLNGKRTNANPRALLNPYRRSDESLSRWSEFEILVPQPKKERRSS